MGLEDGTNSIEEGRIAEGPCACCGRREWRVFGEFEGPHGELTSYAFGWVPEHDERVAAMTIGMGAGNEGGGTFHVHVHVDAEGAWGMGLVDEPFEDVPEGGPDLSREEALAHEDLPWIWHVADGIMLLDRRAEWMLHWLKDTGAVATTPVIHDQAPVLRVVRGEKGFELYGRDEDAELALFHLYHALDADPSLSDVLHLDVGETAERAAPGTPWLTGPTPPG